MRAENPDATDTKLNSEPIDSADAKLPSEPNDPIEANDPAEPIDRMDPVEPMDRMDLVEPIDRIEPPERLAPGTLRFFMIRLWHWPSPGGGRRAEQRPAAGGAGRLADLGPGIVGGG